MGVSVLDQATRQVGWRRVHMSTSTESASPLSPPRAAIVEAAWRDPASPATTTAGQPPSDLTPQKVKPSQPPTADGVCGIEEKPWGTNVSFVSYYSEAEADDSQAIPTLPSSCEDAAATTVGRLQRL